MEGFLKRNIKNFIKKKTPIMALAAVLMLSLMFVFISSNIFADTYDYNNPTYKWNVGKDQSSPVWAYYFEDVDDGTLVFKSEDPNYEMVEFNYEVSLLKNTTISVRSGTTWYEYTKTSLDPSGETYYILNSSNANIPNGNITFRLAPWTLMEGVNSSKKITHIVVEDSFKITNAQYLFERLTSLKDITGLEKIDFTENISCNAMFSTCSSLVELDLSSIDTTNVQDMANMFSQCESLESVNLSNFNTEKVTDMSYMFYYCWNLEELDVSGFDVSNVTNMNGMFYECDVLEELDLSNFITENVENMSEMFYDCCSLEELDISNFDTSKVTNMNSMFYYCFNLEELDVSNFNTSNVTDMSKMFYNCSRLTKLDLSNFDTSNVADVSKMLVDCDDLRELNLSSFIFNSSVDTSSFIQYCTKLERIILPEAMLLDSGKPELYVDYYYYKGDTYVSDAPGTLEARTDSFDNLRRKKTFPAYLLNDGEVYKENDPIKVKLVFEGELDDSNFESIKNDQKIIITVNSNPWTLTATEITKDNVNGKLRSIITFEGTVPAGVADGTEIEYWESGNNYSFTTALKDKDGKIVEDFSNYTKLFDMPISKEIYFNIVKDGDTAGGDVSDQGKWIANCYSKKIDVTVNQNYKAEIYKNDTLLTTLTSSGKYRIWGIDEFDDGDTIKVKFVSTQINPPGGGGGGGGGATPTYKITNVSDSVKEISKSSQSGSKISVYPFTNRKVSEVLVTDKKGNKIDVTQTSESTFTFKMPSSDVTVEVKYEEREILLFINKLVAYVDKTEKELDTTPILRNDRTMLPIRFVAENLDAEVTWDEEGRTATITEGETKIVITIGSNKVLVNDKEYELDVVPFIENDRTYLPVRFVSEHLKAKVDWYEPEKKVTITKK